MGFEQLGPKRGATVGGDRTAKDRLNQGAIRTLSSKRVAGLNTAALTGSRDYSLAEYLQKSLLCNWL